MTVGQCHRQRGSQKARARGMGIGQGHGGPHEEGGQKGCRDRQRSGNRDGADEARIPLTVPP